MKILKTSSHLCGVIIDTSHKKKVCLESTSPAQPLEIESPFKVMESQSQNANTQKKVGNFEQYLQSYTENFNPAYLASLEERLKKKELTEAEEQNLEWFGNTFEQGKVGTLLNLTELIEQIILLEECSILLNIHEERKTQKHTLETEAPVY